MFVVVFLSIYSKKIIGYGTNISAETAVDQELVKLRSTLPRQIDMTKWTAITRVGHNLTYGYDIDFAGELPKTTMDELAKSMQKTVCSNTTMLAAIRNGWSYSYEYFGKILQRLAGFHISVCP